MLGQALVRPLEEDWRETLDAVARSRRWPTSRDVARLAARVQELSAAYNDPARARAGALEAGAARLGFAFARDVPKGAAALRELVAAGCLAPERDLRVLDLGAGLGAMTWGLVRALAAQGGSVRVEATWVDADAQALALAEAIVKTRGDDGSRLRVRPVVRPVGRVDDLGRFDLVLLGNTLSELDVGAPDEVRRERHLVLVRGLLERHTSAAGAVVIVEPALRERTRHLHRLRDGLRAHGATVFAPCLHGAPCPALARETDWCHEDLSVDLPPWLVPVARAAGLRHEGLTFSYLILRTGGPTLAGLMGGSGARLRVVSDLIRSKGKREAFLCGEFSHEGALAPARVRVDRLDRDASSTNSGWERLRRGDVLAIEPAPELERARLGTGSVVRRLERTAEAVESR